MLRSELSEALLVLHNALGDPNVAEALHSLRRARRRKAPDEAEFDYVGVLKTALDLADLGHKLTPIQWNVAKSLEVNELLLKDWWINRMRAAEEKAENSSHDRALWEADARVVWVIGALPAIARLLSSTEERVSEAQGHFTILFPDDVDLSSAQLTAALDAVDELSALFAKNDGNHPEPIVIERLDSGSAKLLELGSKAVSSLMKAANLVKEVALKMALLPQRQAMAQIEVIARSTEAVVDIEAQVSRGALTRQQGDSFCAAVHATLFKFFGTGATVPGAERSEQVLALPEPEPQKLLEGPKTNDNEEARAKGRKGRRAQAKRRPKPRS